MSLREGNSRVLGRLLEEVSWVGSKIRNYHQGGRGFENVLTAEVFQALDFLPRKQFLGAVIEASHGAEKVRMLLRQEIEQSEFRLLPGVENSYLIPSAGSHQTKLSVQPDGIIQSPSCYGILEAKRIQSSSFQAEQLAREFVLVMRDAQHRHRQPLLWLVLGSAPPVRVKGHGRLLPKDAILHYLDLVLARAENHNLVQSTLIEQIDEVVCWTTWEAIAEVVRVQAENMTLSEPSLRGCIHRLTESIKQSVAWHS
ncbi:hypothetical protein H6F76_02180 [Leptolyngbya sp. FACHB-321]|uniref:hypothetical protein n=1 Tax=Leptolyngbya sp. FACHB-321 TaxID=2692807 RepID=UPI001687C9DD|nr:hypothetical protein [Leptolyngbya sp. FACHB-321]MBD2033861.1 hypothetical protein [Leptolyngbya sp. FACHB-321]